MMIRVRRGSVTYRLLTGPTLHRTTLERARASRLTYGLDGEGRARLSPLGVLNGLFGLVLWMDEP